MIKISIADNQPVVMHGLRSFFRNHLKISVVNSIYNLKDLESGLKNTKSNLLIIDIELEGLHSINSLKKIIKEHPNTKVLIYTAASEKLFGVTSLKIGAAGFISKNIPLKNLEEAILNSCEGKIIFSAAVHKSIISSAKVNKEEPLHRKLSSREKEVLNYLVAGKKQ